jgi:hypothetical protein
MTSLTPISRAAVRRGRDESGYVLVFVAMTLMTLLGVSMLAIDVGMVMTARTQAQNSADAGALAGAIALLFEDFDDRSASGPAVQNALAAARGNQVMNQTVSVTPADVTFPPNGGGGLTDRVQVNVFRSAQRSNAVTNLVAAFFGFQNTDVEATATAEASPANAAECVLPFAVPDKWVERQTGPWDPTDTFTPFPKNPSVQPDSYVDAASAGYTGYTLAADKGRQLVLKAGTGHNIAPSFYYAIALPGSTGGADYRWNIANCNTSRLTIFQLLTAEPGNMVGPTKQGVQDLIDQDPGAYWDAGQQKVISTMNPSPRVKMMPIFDPLYYEIGKKNGRNADLKAANFVGIFVEGMQGNDVIGRIVPKTGLLDSTAGPAPAGAFPKVIRLIQ